jgi:hypothetical protein
MVSEAGKTLKLLKSSEVHRLAYLLKNAHAIAKQNRPLTDYKWLCQVDKSKGLDITKLPNSEQSYKGKVNTHNYTKCINRQNQSTTGKL